MLNKHKRSIILSMVLGDGCLHYIKNNGKIYGGLAIDHGLEQSDYVTWKAQIVSKIVQKEIRLRNGHKGKSIQFQISWKRLRSWRRFCYPNGKKAITRILPFIHHPEFAIAIWLMDDGYVEPSFSKIKTGKKNYGARFRIFTDSQPIEDHEYFIKWFQDNLQVTPKIKLRWDSKYKKHYPFLKFTQEDSLKIWSKIRKIVLKLRSMRYKFRYIEEIYQKKLSQSTPP